MEDDFNKSLVELVKMYDNTDDKVLVEFVKGYDGAEWFFPPPATHCSDPRYYVLIPLFIFYALASNVEHTFYSVQCTIVLIIALFLN